MLIPFACIYWVDVQPGCLSSSFRFALLLLLHPYIEYKIEEIMGDVKIYELDFSCASINSPGI